MTRSLRWTVASRDRGVVGEHADHLHPVGDHRAVGQLVAQLQPHLWQGIGLGEAGPAAGCPERCPCRSWSSSIKTSRFAAAKGPIAAVGIGHHRRGDDRHVVPLRQRRPHGGVVRKAGGPLLEGVDLGGLGHETGVHPGHFGEGPQSAEEADGTTWRTSASRAVMAPTAGHVGQGEVGLLG